MEKFQTSDIPKSPRIQKLVDALYEHMPVIESSRAKLLTESYKETEGEPIITRRAKAFAHILHHIPIIIRDNELIVGSSTIAPRGCQTFPEFSYEWLEAELDTVATRTADPFDIAEQTKADLLEADKYWKGRTTSELATSYMAPEAIKAIEHNIFTPGNYFYNGVGHVTVKYWEVLEIGFEGIMEKTREELKKCNVGDGDYARKSHFLEAVLISCQAVIDYAHRYAQLAEQMASQCTDPVRKQELLQIAANCSRVPGKGADSFYEACQSFWFIQQLLQMESSGHSISPGRFDQYMYPYYKKDVERGALTREYAQELMDCIWVKLNDLNKCRDAASAEGFAGYSLFQNLIAGGQNSEGEDVTNDLSIMCIQASMHVRLPQPSLSVRVWNGSPHEFLIKAAELTRTGIGLPAYYNDEVIIPALQNRGLSLADARDYNIIGCVEPQKAGKTEGWHDAAFFNMCRPLELVFSNGMDKGEMVGIPTDILTDSNGHRSEGIQTLRIEDFDGNVKKEYYRDGLYITNISVGNTLIEFELSAKSGDTYTVQKKDTIMNNGKAAANNVKIELISASRTGVRVKLVLSETAQTENPLAFYAKISNTKEEFISLDKQIPQESTYYVYARGGLDSTWTDPAKAVQRADEQGGVVLNRAQQYVWERGNKKTKIQLDTMEIPDIVLEGTLDKKVLKKKLRKTGTVIDLSGCSLDSVLYEVSAQRPVIAKTGDNTSVVIVGYDEYNTYLYDPVKKETYPYGMNDSTDLFQKAGNIFITYIEAVQAVQK